MSQFLQMNVHGSYALISWENWSRSKIWGFHGDDDSSQGLL